ncbi:uncharacterized protein LOC103314888 [Tribolium castaneum]|uniref:Cohesin subunit SA-1-like Protein n=1 Tax=Tribolium castaneum TaxID=7070 RepID=D6W6B4_TRICA|nr:PREDICTED: uncharacterized protein LOC103314888 [Tribolium castaneum]EFA11375.2 Cohesin subunit SA-1-like Protein [Tribolium castaneum]|eukprot:XP_008200300.1 PREDICTED: uncharacterized protein LOC103314888 [Tribolium castaneum]
MSHLMRILRADDQVRESQQSRATSTPRDNNSPNFSSPSVSTIPRDEEPMEDGDSDENWTKGTSDDADSSLCESLAEVSISSRQTAKRLKWENFWRSLKPKNTQSLYYKIMTQPEKLDSITVELIDTYKTNKKFAIFCILQLFVDLSGYKKLSIGEVYDFERGNSYNVVQRMESDLLDEELKKTGKFLFMKPTSFVKDAEHIFAQFLDHLLIQAFKSQVLFDEVFAAHVFEFVRCMCLSPVSGPCVTGLITVINLITSFLKLHQNLIALSDEIDRNSSSETISVIQRKIEDHIDFLYFVFDKHCLLSDKRGALVKIRSAQETFQWIRLYPETFILKRRCLGPLLKMTLDQHEFVRLAALKTIEKLIHCQEISDVLKQRIEMCLKFASGRIVDVSPQVAVMAIHVFTVATESYFDKITTEHKNKIIQEIYFKDVILGKAAGEFLVAYLHRPNTTGEHFLFSLVLAAFSKPEFVEQLPIFLESVFEFADELKDWPLFVQVFLNDDIRLGAKTALLKILNECVRFVLTGKFSYSRQVSQVLGRCDDEEHIQIANAIIPNFTQLLILFQAEKVSLQKLIELLSFIDYSVCRVNGLNDDFSKIFSILKEMFKATADRTLLQNITNVFAVFCEQRHYYKATLVVESLKTWIESLPEDLNQMTPDCDKTLLIQIRNKSLKASTLFSRFDLTKVLQWQDIFPVLETNFFKVLKYLVVCCKWHLIWRLRQFMRLPKDDNGSEPISPLLYNDCKEFVYECLKMFTQEKSNSDLFLVLETLCDLYTDFENELKRKREYSHFVIKITEPRSLEILFNFVVQHIINNKEMPLKERQKLLRKVINLLYLDVIPCEYFSKILRFYHTHNNEFGYLMDHIFGQLKITPPALPLIVMHTLAEIYQEILEKRQIVDLRTEETKFLKKLAKKFASVKEMRSNQDILKFIIMALNFTCRTEQHYPFLSFAKYFAKHLNEDGKSDAYEIFRKSVPKEAEKNEIFLLFAKTLK